MTQLLVRFKGLYFEGLGEIMLLIDAALTATCGWDEDLTIVPLAELLRYLGVV